MRGGQRGGDARESRTEERTGGVRERDGRWGEIKLDEQGAIRGYAGQSVRKQTRGQEWRKGLKRRECVMEKGFIDHIVSRSEMKEKISTLISLLT